MLDHEIRGWAQWQMKEARLVLADAKKLALFSEPPGKHEWNLGHYKRLEIADRKLFGAVKAWFLDAFEVGPDEWQKLCSFKRWQGGYITVYKTGRNDFYEIWITTAKKED